MSDKVVNALTKFHQDDETLKRMAEKALGATVNSFTAKELSGGMCNAVYLIDADGKRMVLKIAPPKGIKVMRHEVGITETEAKMLKLFHEKSSIPCPELVSFINGDELCRVPYFFMSFIEGQSLLTMNPRPEETNIQAVKREVGEICRKICDIRSDRFGVPALPDTYFDNNTDFLLKLFSMLFNDAEDKEIRIPGITADTMLEKIESLREILNEATTPCYIHTDTWDGNLMIKDDKLSGMLDFAAILWGDPLMSHDFHDFGDAPRAEFLDGFGKTAFSRNEEIRISVYKLWQRLGMIVERGYRGYENPNQYTWVFDTFTSELANLNKLTA